MSLSLKDVQQQFQAAVLNLQQVPDFIADAEAIGAEERFGVYTEAYRLRIVGALAVDFPALKAVLGDDGFNALCRAYISYRPSDHFSIRWFGRFLCDFLAEAEDYQDQHGLRDLAQFEWALSEAFDAPDAESVTLEQAKTIPIEQWPVLKLTFLPSSRRVDLTFNAPQVWLAVSAEEPLPELAAHAEKQAWHIWRHELKLLFRSLPPEEAYALDAFRQGQNFSEVCEGLCGFMNSGQATHKAAEFLPTWLRDGWVAGFGFDDC